MATSQHYVVGLIKMFLYISLVSGSVEELSEWLPDNVYLSDFQKQEEVLNTAAAEGRLPNETVKFYKVGVLVGIVDPKKYPIKLFKQHEKYYKSTLKKYNELKGGDPVTYGEWLLLNNYGVLLDTQEPILKTKKKALSSKVFKNRFIQSVKKGDILITNKKGTGLIGHAGMMANDNYAIEMPGGKMWLIGIKDNNRRLTAGEWFDEYSSAYTTVYRCRDKELANDAADWAYRNYYNPKLGHKKTIHTTYRITPFFKSTDPSYCSKLVLQAFYYSDNSVVNNILRYGPFIIPAKLPGYFNPACDIMYVGRF